MKTRWIVVADASRARVLARTGRRLAEVEDLVHPESRLHARDIVSGRAGRQSGSGGERHQVDPRTDPKETEAVAFAHQIAERLGTARGQGAFDELVLVAPPHFLGLLRQELEHGLRGQVVQSIDKDLVRADLSTIEAELEKVP